MDISDHVNRDQIGRFLRHELAGEELLEIDAHLAACAACSAAAAAMAEGSSEAFVRSVLPALESEHLTYREFEGYIDDSLADADAERIRIHLARCSECADEAAELRSLSPADKGKAAFAGSTVRVADRDWMAKWFSRGRLGLVAAAGIIVILAGLGWIAWKRSAVAESAAVVERPRPPLTRSADTRPPAELRFSMTDGKEIIGLDNSGSVVGFSDLDLGLRAALAKALKDGEVTIGSEAAKLGETSGDFELIDPVAKVIETDTPEFSWKPAAGVRRYLVEVHEKNGKKVAESGPIEDSTWSTPLTRGTDYEWRVSDAEGGPKAKPSSADFRVISAVELSEIENAKRLHPNSDLLLGLVFAGTGMIDEAAARFRSLQRANPGSAQANRLLQTVETARLARR